MREKDVLHLKASNTFTLISMPPQAAQINIEIARICKADQNGMGPILRAICA